MISEKEVLEALHTLQQVCVENDERCHNCMLRNGENYCAVMMNSAGDTHDKLTDWEIKSLTYPRLILN